MHTDPELVAIRKERALEQQIRNVLGDDEGSPAASPQ
jgi:hypothetical protein